MFKFATSKFSGSNSHQQQQQQGSNGVSNTPSMQTHGNQDSSSSRRQQIQKNLFYFKKITDKGFPSKPSTMDYDKKLRLLGIGTKNGDIRLYGEPGTPHQQLACSQDIHPFPILKLLFIQGQHQLITLSERSYRNDRTNKNESNLYLILWQIPAINADSTQLHMVVDKIKEYQLDQKAISGSRLSAMTILNDNSHLFIGFESGDVYVFNVATFQLVPGVINKDYILKNIPTPAADSNNKKLTSLGAVESICHHPRQLTKLLIAYQRGLWIIFDFIKNQIDQINQTQQQLESASFYQAGECVATSHSDGSFILWDLEQITQVGQTNQCSSSSEPNIVYGPYPCKAVTKCFVKTCRNDQPYVIFSGGCPRVNYSDKITISVIQGESAHVCFDFTSKIIEFFTVDKPHVDKQATQPTTYDNPQALFVLLEEEFVAIDLVTEGWPQYKLPYLNSVHSSAIICTHFVNDVSKSLYDRLKLYGCKSGLGNINGNELYSEKDWPIMSSASKSGTLSPVVSEKKDLLLTGHEDGSIRFWDVTHMSMTLIYRLKTSDYFQTDVMHEDSEAPGETTTDSDSDNWPPFRKVGTFDPYSDDPKLGIQKIHLCPQKEVLVVGGTAGQVMTLFLNDQPREMPYSQLKSFKINITSVSPEAEQHYVWKGHEPLQVRNGNSTLKLQAGYQLQSIVQLYPPATISALAINTDWQLVAMGTSHGFVLFDYLNMKDLLVKCTLDPALLLASHADSTGANTGTTTLSRRKSLKKSLRESFRKLRRGRSQKPNNKTIKQQPIDLINKQMNIEEELNEAQHHKPIERQVESREFKPMDDIPPSVIRFMYFVRTFITSSHQQTNSLWVGTNTGVIYIYALQFQLNSSHIQQQIDPKTKTPIQTSTIRSNQSVNCFLAKEMRLKHRAPVVHIQVIDQNLRPLPLDKADNGADLSAQVGAAHKVIICSEEQFKVFQLPALKPVCKFKLTAVEGARVRRIGYNCFTSRIDPKYSEYCLSCLSNLGDISIYSLPQLKRQLHVQCMKQQDINAITSFVFSKQAQALYLQSPSEFVHVSMSARDSFQPVFKSPTVDTLKKNTPTSVPQSNSSVSIAKKSTPQTPAASASATSPQSAQTPNSLSSTQSPNTSDNVSQLNSTQSPSNGTTNNASLSSPSQQQPAPPVPAPRTIIPQRDDTTNTNNSNTTNSNTNNKSINNNNNRNSTAINQVVGKTDEIECQEDDEKRQDQTNDLSSSIQIDQNDVSSLSMVVSSSMKHHSKLDATSSSLLQNLNSTNKQLTSSLNQSNISTHTLNQPNLNNTEINGTNMNNIINSTSLSAGQYIDSFNANSSGYNGSTSCVGLNSHTDMSMDSVVDRTNESEDCSKKVPPVIFEDSPNMNKTNNDSLLSESLNKININSESHLVNGHQNGQINHTFDNQFENVKERTNVSKTNGTDARKSNGHVINGDAHHNGHMNGDSHNKTIDILPQKSSSPLSVKSPNGQCMNHQQNGTYQNRSNKIELVTKQIENDSKLKYRETAID